MRRFRRSISGAAVLTIIFGFFWPALLARWTWFTCPVDMLYLTIFPPELKCTVNPVFVPQTYQLPVIGTSVQILPIQFHGVIYAMFASLVAPFGKTLLHG